MTVHEPSRQSIIDQVIRHGRGAVEPPLVSGPTGALTREQFISRVRQAARDLRPTGSPAMRCLPITERDPLDQLIGIAAAHELGISAIVTDPGWPARVERDAVAAARLALDTLPAADRQQAALVVFTSGSTGTPQPVIRSLASWTSSYRSLSHLTAIGRGDSVLIPGRLSSSLFLFGALHALASGAALQLLPGWTAAGAATAARSATVVHLVPTMLADLLRGLPTRTTVRLAACAGAQLPDGLRARAASAGVQIFDYYGASELSFVAYRQPGEDRMRPFPGVDIASVAPDHPPGAGILRVRSPYLATNATVDDAGFATAGDRGVVHADGTITVLGRNGTVITSGGATVVPEGVEAVLTSVPEVAEALVLGRPHPELGQLVTALIEPLPGRAPTAAHLRAVVADRLPRSDRPREWLITDHLPRTSTGKVARAEATAALSAGSLPVRRLT